jgi:hypothetical protein
MKIEVFSRLEHYYTSASIAQLAERLTFFIWFWPGQTWSERAQVQFLLEEHDFFSSFKLFFLSIFCMHLYHILINWSQKFWVVYVQYRFIYEQCDSAVSYSLCCKASYNYPVNFMFRSFVMMWSPMEVKLGQFVDCRQISLGNSGHIIIAALRLKINYSWMSIIGNKHFSRKIWTIQLNE